MIDKHGMYGSSSQELDFLYALALLIDIFTPVCETIGVIITVAVVSYAAIEFLDETLEQVHDLIFVQEKADENNYAVFYGVDLFGGIVNARTGPMTFDEAAMWAISTAASGKYSQRAAWGLVTKKSEDAFAMALFLGSIGAVSFDEALKNHMAHYHPAGRLIMSEDHTSAYCAKSFHVWYGTPSGG